MKLMKHVGKYGNKPCVVLFREVPGEQDNCLIVLSDALDMRLHQDVMRVIDSEVGQASNDISEVLHRNKTTDGENMLEVLHRTKMIQKVPVKMVSLTPYPNQSMPLSDVNDELRKLKAGSHETQNDVRLRSQDIERPPETSNPVSVDTNPLSSPPVMPTIKPGEEKEVAQNLLFQAEMMEADAQRLQQDAQAKREQAYSLSPDLSTTVAESSAEGPVEATEELVKDEALSPDTVV